MAVVIGSFSLEKLIYPLLPCPTDYHCNMNQIFGRIKGFFRHLLESILRQMEEREYRDIVTVGTEIIKKIEAFFIVNKQDHWGPNHCTRLSDFSVFYYYSTREFMLHTSVARDGNQWGYIEVKIPPPGGHHAKCDYKHWVKTPAIIRFDRLGNIIYDESLPGFTITEVPIDKLLEYIYDKSPRNDP